MQSHKLKQGKHTTGPPLTRHALTLVETVLALTCAAVLLACLVPATAAVSGKSKQAQCLTQLARIGSANLIYATEDPSNADIPIHPQFYTQNQNDPTYIGAYEWGGKSGIGKPGHTNDPGIFGSRYGTAAGFGPATRPLNRILFGELPDYTNDPGSNYVNWESDTQLALDAMQCPSDTGPPPGAHCPDWRINTGRSSYDHFGTSYNANIFMTGNSAGGSMSSQSPYLHRLRDVPVPSETVLYQENIGRWAWAVRENPQCQWLGAGVFPEGTIRGWHGKNWMFTAAFVDGHADTLYMNGHESVAAYADDNANEQFRCIVVRGPSWRLDTAPLPRAEVPFAHPGGSRASYENCVISE